MTQPTATGPDLGELPRFEALKKWINERPDKDTLTPVLKWIDKLESWCKAAHEEHRKHEDIVDDHKGEILQLEAQLGAAQGERDAALGLVEVVEDIDRGICDMDDLKDAIGRLPERG